MKIVKSVTGSRAITIMSDAENTMGAIGISASGCGYYAVPRADFLAAVESELDVRLVSKDAVVVERLPEARIVRRSGTARSFLGDVATTRTTVSFDYGDMGHTEEVPPGLSADELIALGLALKAHPPVDEAEVEALADMIEGLNGCPDPDLARRPLATGRVHVSGEAGA